MMDTQQDPYQLTPEEKTQLIGELQQLLEETDPGVYSNLENFLRNRRQYLEGRLGSPQDVRVFNRLMFDIYKKNYTLIANNLFVEFMAAEGRIEPTEETMAVSVNYAANWYQSDGAPFSATIALKPTNPDNTPATYYVGNQLTCAFQTEPSSSNALTDTVIDYTFTVTGNTSVPPENQSFVSIFKEQLVSFTAADTWSDVLGRPAYMAGFFEYNPVDEGKGVVNLFLRYREK